MNSLEDLERRIRRIEDREAIRVLVGRYTIAMDDKNFDLAETLFADDARFGWHGGTPMLVGRAAIMEMYRSRLGQTGPSFHVTHDQFVEFDPADENRATGQVHCHAEITAGDRQHIAAIRYSDSYLRVDGRWMFAERILAFLYNLPVADYDGVLLRKDRIVIAGAAQPAHWP